MFFFVATVHDAPPVAHDGGRHAIFRRRRPPLPSPTTAQRRCEREEQAQKCAQTCDACGVTAALTTPMAAMAACADLKRAICAKRKREGRLTCRRAAERRKCAESCGECRVS